MLNLLHFISANRIAFCTQKIVYIKYIGINGESNWQSFQLFRIIYVRNGFDSRLKSCTTIAFMYIIMQGIEMYVITLIWICRQISMFPTTLPSLFASHTHNSETMPGNSYICRLESKQSMKFASIVFNRWSSFIDKKTHNAQQNASN